MLTEYHFDLTALSDPSERPELHRLSFDIQGYRYRAEAIKVDRTDEVLFLPKADNILFHNSFVPEVRIREDASGYHVTGALNRGVRILMRLILAMVCVMQGVEIIGLLVGKTGLSFSFFVPVIIALGLFLMTYVSTAAVKKTLIKSLEKTLLHGHASPQNPNSRK